jgi:nucleotide-binding universal stress UspA family protein
MTATFKDVLCAVDFSAASRSALDTAVRLVRDAGASAALTLIHVVHVPAYPLSVGVLVTPSLRRELLESADRELADWKKAAEAEGVNASVLRLEGTPWQSIVEEARARRSDLIVVGTHGRTGLTHAIIGSTAERVARHAPCAVLVTRSPAE